jgi:hypothetical protein
MTCPLRLRIGQGGFVAGVIALVWMGCGMECVVAQDKSFVLGGTVVNLEDVSEHVGVVYRSMRFNRSLNEWNFEAFLTNGSARVVSGPIVLFVESASGAPGSMAPDGWDEELPPRPCYDLTGHAPGGRLNPGSVTRARTLALKYTATQPHLNARVYGRITGNLALALTRSLNEVGQPLPTVEVIETASQGSSTLLTDPDGGWVTLGREPGPYLWEFRASGYLPCGGVRRWSSGKPRSWIIRD